MPGFDKWAFSAVVVLVIGHGTASNVWAASDPPAMPATGQSRLVTFTMNATRSSREAGVDIPFRMQAGTGSGSLTLSHRDANGSLGLQSERGIPVCGGSLKDSLRSEFSLHCSTSENLNRPLKSQSSSDPRFALSQDLNKSYLNPPLHRWNSVKSVMRNNSNPDLSSNISDVFREDPADPGSGQIFGIAITHGTVRIWQGLDLELRSKRAASQESMGNGIKSRSASGGVRFRW